MTNKIVILDNSIELYEHYIDDTRWERTLAFPRGGVTYLVSNWTIKFYAYEDYLYRNCLISMQLPIYVVDEFEHIDGEYEDIDELASVLDRIFPTNDIDAQLDEYLRIEDAELLYQPIGDYALKSEIPDVSNLVTDEELVDALDDYVEKEGFNSYTAETASVIQELDNRKADKSELSPYFNGASYDEETREIRFYHNGQVKTQIDATPFIKDGMVNSVRLENGYLIITFNTDAGKEPISINIGSIFEPSNYYTKDEIDDNFQPKGNYVSASTYTSFTSTTNASINNLRTTKLDASAYTPSDLSNYYTKDEVYTKGETYNRNEIDDNFQPKGNYVSDSTYTSFTSTTEASIDKLRSTKLDISAYTPSDLSNYYTKAEIGDNFQPIGNYVSASTYTSFTSSTEASIQTLRGTKLDISAYTPSDLSDYYTKSEVYSKDETYNRNEIDDKITQSGTFDPTQYYTKGQCDTRFALKDEMPSLNGYATEEWVTSKNYATNAELVTYVNNLQQQINSLMATVSGCCGAHEDVYRWITVIGEYLCENNNKYEKQKYQVSHDGGITWEDVTPIQYQKGQLIESNSKDCGYAPQPQYRWQKALSTDYMCSGTSKYYKLYYQVSNDGGQTWENVSPEQTKIGGLIESNSSDCGYVTPQYRWQKAPSTDYVCSGTTKYYKEYYQVSYDGGETWENVSPEQTRTSIDIIESNSADCGYIKTFCSIRLEGIDKWYYIGNAEGTISRSDLEARLTSTQIANIYSIYLHDGCNHIENGAFQGLTKLSDATLGNVKTVGDNAYNGCTRLHSVVRSDYVKTIGTNAFKDTAITDFYLPETLTSIGDGAFSGCSKLLQIFMLGKTPPTIGDAVFDGDNMLTAINVPSESVDAYKAADGWKDYASLITPINI